MFQTMQNILARVCKIGSQQILIIGCLTLCLRWIPVISVERLSRSSVGLTHCQHRQNSQPISKVNEIRAFDYPILVIPRWDRQTIHYMILLTEIGAKNESRIMSYNSRTFFAFLRKEKKVAKIFFYWWKKIIFLEKKNYSKDMVFIAWATRHFVYIYCIYVLHYFLSAALEDFKTLRKCYRRNWELLERRTTKLNYMYI